MLGTTQTAESINGQACKERRSLWGLLQVVKSQANQEEFLQDPPGMEVKWKRCSGVCSHSLQGGSRKGAVEKTANNSCSQNLTLSRDKDLH